MDENIVARTDPAAFRNPYGRRNKAARALWGIVWRLLFRPTPPRLLCGWRRMLLRLFGAKVGRAWFHPRVRIWAPWMLEVGDDVFVDEDVYLYNAYGVTIGDRVIISLRSFLCTASHDAAAPAYDLTGGRITVGKDCWLAAEVFVGPGVTIGEGTVVGARAVVIADLPPWQVAVGHPARPVKPRTLRGPVHEQEQRP